jgi:hypothetical protein
MYWYTGVFTQNTRLTRTHTESAVKRRAPSLLLFKALNSIPLQTENTVYISNSGKHIYLYKLTQ